MKKIFCIILCVVALLSCLVVPSFAEETTVSEEIVNDSSSVLEEGIYYDCYDLVSTYVYGGDVDSPDVKLVCTFLASCLSILAVALPFVVVWFVIKLILSVGVRLI